MIDKFLERVKYQVLEVRYMHNQSMKSYFSIHRVTKVILKKIFRKLSHIIWMIVLLKARQNQYYQKHPKNNTNVD
jgi:hypothetical protein